MRLSNAELDKVTFGSKANKKGTENISQYLWQEFKTGLPPINQGYF
jgi:hypothetical protein